jgi:hypothetical protein
MIATRRRLQVALGLIWLLDGLLQLQPFMFRRSFATQILEPAAQGQPTFVHGPVMWSARIVASHPIPWDSLFAAIQVGIGVLILASRTRRAGLAASVVWGLGVWWFGEGLGGIFGGQASLLNGAPGAVIVYAALALAAWPRSGTSDTTEPPAAWVASLWAVLWIGGAILMTIVTQTSTTTNAGIVSGNADGAPRILTRIDTHVASWLHSGDGVLLVVLIAVQASIGLGGLLSGRNREIACWAGIGLSLAFWIVGQSVGQLYSGQATDPNTAPLVILLALALRGAPPLPALRLSATRSRIGPAATG